MKIKKTLAGALSALLLTAGAVGIMAPAASADTEGTVGVFGDVQPWSAQTNQVGYWESQFSAHDAVCYKHDGDSDHGKITDDGKTVTLNAFDPSWPGDHWEALIVKGGSVSNNVIAHPQAGVAYASPVNAGSKQSNVSHWIVCKGTTPEVTPTPTPTVTAPTYKLTTSHVEQCGQVTVTLRNESPWIYPVSFKVDDGPSQYGATVDNRGDAPDDQSNSKTFTFAEDSGTHTVAYRVDAGTESDLYAGLPVGEWTTVTVDSDCLPNPPVIGQCASTGSTQFTSLADWTMTETRATGHNDLVDGGLHVWTEGATSTDKAAGYYPASFDLKDAGSGFGVTATGTGSAQPSLQMLVDLDGNGSPEGYLVAEPVYGADTLWLSSNWTHIDLSAAPTTVNGGGTGKGGTANAWLAAFPDAHVSAIGYSLGSGVLGDWTITAITAGCHVYTFDRPEAPAIPAPTTVTTTGDWMGGEPTCDEPSVEQTRTVTTVTTTYAAPQWVDNAWVEDATGTAGEPVITTETRAVAYQGDDCATPTPTPTSTPTVIPTVTPQPTVAPTVKTPHVQEVVHGDLAETGGTINPYALSIGALLLAAGIGAIVIAVARSKRA